MLAGILLVTLATACGPGMTDQDGRTTGSDEAFWSPLRIVGDEVEGYPTLAAAAEAADVVARGQVSDFAFSRETSTDTVEDVVTYGVMWFEPEEPLRGNVDQGLLPVEFLINVPPDRAKATIESQRANLPDDDIVVLLRAKQGTGEDGLYRLVNSTGLWVVRDGILDAPLATGDSDAVPYQAELADVTTLDDLTDMLR